MHLYLSYQKFYRVLECVVSCFDHELCRRLISIIVDNTLNIIITTEGFFLFKALVCSVKLATLQLEIVEKFKLIFLPLVESHHGSLVLKHLVEAFRESKFVYVKYFSKFLNANCKRKAQQNKIVNQIDRTNLNSQALEVFHMKMFEYVKYWDRKQLNVIVEYSLKNCEVFQKLLIKQIQKRQIFVQLMRLEMADKIIGVVNKCLTHSDSDILHIINQYLLTTNIERSSTKARLQKMIYNRESSKQLHRLQACYNKVETAIHQQQSFYQPQLHTVMLISSQNLPCFYNSSNYFQIPQYYSYPNFHSYYSIGKEFNSLSSNGFNN